MPCTATWGWLPPMGGITGQSPKALSAIHHRAGLRTARGWLTFRTAAEKRRSTSDGWTAGKRRRLQISKTRRRISPGRPMASGSRTSHVPAKPSWSTPMPEKPVGAKWAELPIIVTRLHWRQDAQGLIKPGYTHIFVVPATGGPPRQISLGDYEYGAPAWPSDGQWILASTKRTPDADYDLEGADIIRVGRSLGRRENPLP